jgi:hypothetical protein
MSKHCAFFLTRGLSEAMAREVDLPENIEQRRLPASTGSLIVPGCGSSVADPNQYRSHRMGPGTGFLWQAECHCLNGL